jgi:signal peptidase I
MVQHRKYTIWIYLLAAGGLVLVSLFSYEFLYRFRVWSLRAFRVPSRSMYPTICKDERVFVQMQYGKPYLPKRGDVIAFLYGEQKLVYIKRVIGLPGDIVSPGRNGTILVNGRPWVAPPVCGSPVLESDNDHNPAPYLPFQETGVLPGHLFVIGDNLYESFDSRINQFAPVTADMVIGRPVMIYWSRGSARIGCPVK